MYIIIEMQTSGGVTAVVTPVVKDTLAEAQQAFYGTCSYAAVSAVQLHVVLLLHASGNVIDSKAFRHGGDE